MDALFRFKHFSLHNEKSALKVGTDAVLLGATASLQHGTMQILDIGTGTGVIALMLAQRCTEAVITGIDIDTPSAEEATLNFKSSPWSDRLKALNIDLNDYHPLNNFDLIVSNPPYYNSSLINQSSREATARHSVQLYFSDICAFSDKYLSPEGRLSLIFPSGIFPLWKCIAASFALFPSNVIYVRTTDKKPPKRVIAEFVKGSKVSTSERTLTLLNNGKKSEEYFRLTEDFYL